MHVHPASHASPSAKMAGMSLLKSVVAAASRFLPASRQVPAGTSLFRSLPRASKVPVRFGSQGKKLFVVEPTHFYSNRFKRLLRFYILLTGIPAGLFITYANIFIGQAELAEIPEGYIPDHWEYYKHPITRWIARYITEVPECSYEKMMALIHIESEKADLRLQEIEARRVMRKRGDGPWHFHETLDKDLINNKHKATPDD